MFDGSSHFSRIIIIHSTDFPPFLDQLSVHTTISNIVFLQVEYLSVHSNDLHPHFVNLTDLTLRFDCCKNNNEPAMDIVQSQWMAPISEGARIRCIRLRTQMVLLVSTIHTRSFEGSGTENLR